MSELDRGGKGALVRCRRSQEDGGQIPGIGPGNGNAEVGVGNAGMDGGLTLLRAEPGQE
jgi:hypothetical protein